MPCPREKREAAEALLIGPHGLLSTQSTGRPTPEPPCEMRTCFQRDVDRITHSKSFRRLKHKTQVFLRPEGDHYRTRLTHTLEVARLARTIARALELNEDLTEAISLGHDLGHTPFGHAGERALNAIYTGVGFRHYEQSLRVVDRIERDGRGLNLCNETRIGILNHTCFQRDVDRITHSKSFRRLKHKTQVFLRPEGDHYRTRLTHTLEVARLARTIARALELNEDLTEAISLGHDLGHTPFGHAGERALNAIYTGVGFRHYEQSLRVVDRIERDGRGLNLCNETRIGILNHTTGQPRGTLEADVVRLADRVAYINHDLDDAMRGGIVQPEDVPAIVRERVGERNSVRINSILTDIIAHSGDGELRMSPDMREAVDVFTTFMYEGVYYNPIAKGEERKVQNILGSIWEYYVNHIDELPVVYQSIADDEGPQRAVCDYVSGMTDSYALEVYSELFIPAAWTIK